MAVKCANCGGAHPSWDCSKPTKSTQAQKVATVTTVKEFDPPDCVDTPPKQKMGRPRTGYIKAEYNRQYMADKRAADKLGVTVRDYRAALKFLPLGK